VFVGKPILPKESLNFLKGYGEYIDDVVPKGVNNCSCASIVRSPYSHAQIVEIDPTDALRRSGVRAVFTFNDFKNILNPFPLALESDIKYYPIASQKVLFCGEPVAVVIADDDYTAEDAKELVRVEYNPNNPVLTIEDSLRELPIFGEADSNVVMNRTFTFGNFDDLASRAEVVVEDSVHFPRYTCAPLETCEVFAEFNENGYNIFSNFQGPYTIHYLLSKALGAPIRLLGPRNIGGSFGIKTALYPYMALIAASSRLVGRPIKWNESRTEHFLACSTGAERISQTKLYGNRNGKIYAVLFDFIDNLGAYPRPPEPANLLRTHGNLTGAYKIEGIKVTYRAVVTNTIPTGLNRGFGGPHLYLALESAVNSFAKEIKMDQLHLRIRNAIDHAPYRTPSGGRYEWLNCISVLKKLENVSKYNELNEFVQKIRNEGGKIGIGISLIIEPSGTNIGYLDLARKHDHLPKSAAQEVVLVSIDPYGKITVTINGTNEGQSHETVIAQVVADELGTNIDDIDVRYRVDTHYPWTPSSGSYSSRFSPIILSALANALNALKYKLTTAASKLLGVDATDAIFVNGEIRINGKKISLKKIAGVFHWNPLELGEVGGLVTVGFYQSPSADRATEGKINSSVAYGSMAHLAVVQVDEDYKLRILKYYVVHDSGKILNPLLLNAQITGATFHGIEVSTSASLKYNDDGNLLTGSFLDYEVLTSMESPDIEIYSVENETSRPTTSAGAGEGGTMAAPAAIMNAVRDATAFRLEALPLTADLLSSITEQKPYLHVTVKQT
jgi:2-furoyl-CoA dehydrogenase large subunit